MKNKYLFISIPLIWFLIHTTAISIYGLQDNDTQADFAVVPGNTVHPDGSPSERLKGRLDKAAELYNTGRVKYILVSGGTGSEGYDEARVMKNYLMGKKIPEKMIFLDSEGINTLQTARHSFQFSVENRFHSVFIVSQFFHIARTAMLFHKTGFPGDHIYTAHADYFEFRDVYSLFREFFAFYYYLFFL